MKNSLKVYIIAIIISVSFTTPSLVYANGAASAAGKAAGKLFIKKAPKPIYRAITSHTCTTQVAWCQTFYPQIVGSSCSCVDSYGYVSYGIIK